MGIPAAGACPHLGSRFAGETVSFTDGKHASRARRGAMGDGGWVLVTVRQQLAAQTVRIDQHGRPRHSGNYGHFVRRRTVLKLPLLVAAGPTLTQVPRAAAEQSRWSPDRASRWYQAQAWPVGAN